MKFYLDFEAARFTNHIISIGCKAENGNTFYTLVNPKDKIDKFITSLTGITNEELQNAITADEAFIALFDFVSTNNDDKAPKYYFYGESDLHFINSTLKKMTDFTAKVFAQSLIGGYIDYSKEVRKFFDAKTNYSLQNVYNLIKNREVVSQQHNALQDAKMLSLIENKMYKVCTPQDKAILDTMPQSKKPELPSQKKKGKAPDIFCSWQNAKKWEADTGANESNYTIKGIHIDNAPRAATYFKDIEVAALWIMKYVNNMSPNKPGAIDKVKENIAKAIEKQEPRYNILWERKEDNLC